MRRQPNRPSCGFTLIELLVVMVIIGILLALILAAAQAGAREAEIRATQALILKLENALTDRIDAFSQLRIEPNAFQIQMANIYGSTGNPPQRQVMQRAQVLANYEAFRAEFPDVFFVQAPRIYSYPVNFGMRPMNITSANNPNSTSALDYMLPFGVAAGGALWVPPMYPPGTGIYGVSYAAAAGFYKNVGKVNSDPGYDPRGYDGIDNNGNGLIDEYDEGNLSGNGSAVLSALANHQHKTARAEMLYALLIESQGPFGSALDRDEFSTREIGDTDGDGLPEFLDAWGEPIYYFRWPILYPSDVQRGMSFDGTSYNPPYQSIFEARETNTLDPNNQLTSPSWWSASYNAGAPFSIGDQVLSGGVIFFQKWFHQLTEPLPPMGPNPTQQYWDRRTTFSPRRQFYTRPLIISSGPDRTLGLPLLDQSLISTSTPDVLVSLLQLEGEAALASISARASLNSTNISTYHSPDMRAAAMYAGSSGKGTVTDPAPGTAGWFRLMGQDDISNHSLQTAAGATP